MQELYESYKKTLKAVNEQLNDIPTDNPERTQLNNAASDLRYIIEWMETGYPPKPRDDRLSEDQRMIPHDPTDYRFIAMTAAAKKAVGISEHEQDKLNDILRDLLSGREREIFVMTHAGLMSQYAIAKVLGISRASVQTFLERAEKKLLPMAKKASNEREYYIQRSIFE